VVEHELSCRIPDMEKQSRGEAWRSKVEVSYVAKFALELFRHEPTRLWGGGRCNTHLQCTHLVPQR
jgi:hypothetical protein